MPEASAPLNDILIVDFSQFLSGPSASLRLADLGARVIKVERPDGGDICRDLYASNVMIDGDSTIFHAINRNKQGYSADLKNAKDRARVKRLVERADVVIHNFRPGVMERLGFDYASVMKLNPTVVYAEISGYGAEGPWAGRPGQDLLVQAMSGLTWLSGNAGDGPVPMGLAVVDVWAGTLLVQGILAGLVRRGVSEEGTRVEVNMLEAALDFQFEPMTVHLADGSLPERTAANNAHSLLGAPYGVYATTDGFIALAMGSVLQLGTLLECEALLNYAEPNSWFDEREAIKSIIAARLAERSTHEWLEVLEPADIWCAEVLDWAALLAHPAFGVLDMVQAVTRGSGSVYETTVCPIRIDGHQFRSEFGSCEIGEHNSLIDAEIAAAPAGAGGGCCVSAVGYAVEEGVAVLTLNKPKVNAYDLEFMRAVRAAVDRASNDQSVGAVIVKSALERVFCVGADIKAWQANDVDANQTLVSEARGVADAISASEKVFIAVISGHALGGGLELAMACDMRFAAEGEYSLGLPEVKLGLMPGNGGTQRLMRLVGPSFALELIVSGQGISPERAVHLGLVNRLMPRQRVLDESFTFARSLARGPRIATAAIKESIRAGMDLSMDDGLRLEVRLADALYDTPDGIEGFAAYVDKREPYFGA